MRRIGFNDARFSVLIRRMDIIISTVPAVIYRLVDLDYAFGNARDPCDHLEDGARCNLKGDRLVAHGRSLRVADVFRLLLREPLYEPVRVKARVGRHGKHIARARIHCYDCAGFCGFYCVELIRILARLALCFLFCDVIEHVCHLIRAKFVDEVFQRRLHDCLQFDVDGQRHVAAVRGSRLREFADHAAVLVDLDFPRALMRFCRAGQVCFHRGFNAGYTDIIAVGIRKAGACGHVDHMVSIVIVYIHDIAGFIPLRYNVPVLVRGGFVFVERLQFLKRIPFGKQGVCAYGIRRAGKVADNVCSRFSAGIDARRALGDLHANKLAAVLLDLSHNFKIHIVCNGDGRIGSVIVQADFLADGDDLIRLFERVFLRDEPGAAQIVIGVLRRRPFGKIPFGRILRICFVVWVAPLDIEAHRLAEILVAGTDSGFARHAPIINDLAVFIHGKIGSVDRFAAASLNNVDRLDEGFRVNGGIIIRPVICIAQKFNIIACFAVCEHHAVSVQNAPAFPLYRNRADLSSGSLKRPGFSLRNGKRSKPVYQSAHHAEHQDGYDQKTPNRSFHCVYTSIAAYALPARCSVRTWRANARLSTTCTGIVSATVSSMQGSTYAPSISK